DQYGNLETGDNSTVVTASLASGAGPLLGVTTATLSGGVARFSSLSDRIAESFTLRFSSGSLTSPASSAIQNTPTAHTATPTLPPFRRRKIVSTVITIRYSTTMDSQSASLSSNYVLTTKTAKGKKKPSQVKFSPTFDQSANAVTLTIKGKQNAFARGG